MRLRATGGLAVNSIADSHFGNFLGLTSGLRRKRVLANGGLRAVLLGACQHAAADTMFAAIASAGDRQISGGPISFD